MLFRSIETKIHEFSHQKFLEIDLTINNLGKKNLILEEVDLFLVHLNLDETHNFFPPIDQIKESLRKIILNKYRALKIKCQISLKKCKIAEELTHEPISDYYLTEHRKDSFKTTKKALKTISQELPEIKRISISLKTFDAKKMKEILEGILKLIEKNIPTPAKNGIDSKQSANIAWEIIQEDIIKEYCTDFDFRISHNENCETQRIYPIEKSGFYIAFLYIYPLLSCGVENGAYEYSKIIKI